MKNMWKYQIFFLSSPHEEKIRKIKIVYDWNLKNYTIFLIEYTLANEKVIVRLVVRLKFRASRRGETCPRNRNKETYMF